MAETISFARGAPSLAAMVLEATYFEYEALAEAANPPAPVRVWDGV